MKAASIRKGLLFVIAASAFGLGCELIVDFDRSRIPVEGADATTSDGSLDAPVTETGVDAADAADASETEAAAQDADAADVADADDPDADQ